MVIEFGVLDRAIQKEITPDQVPLMLLTACHRVHGTGENATALAMEAQERFYKGEGVEIGVYSFKLIGPSYNKT